jgi:hypothetical protein
MEVIGRHMPVDEPLRRRGGRHTGLLADRLAQAASALFFLPLEM